MSGILGIRKVRGCGCSIHSIPFGCPSQDRRGTRKRRRRLYPHPFAKKTSFKIPKDNAHAVSQNSIEHEKKRRGHLHASEKPPLDHIPRMQPKGKRGRREAVSQAFFPSLPQKRALPESRSPLEPRVNFSPPSLFSAHPSPHGCRQSAKGGRGKRGSSLSDEAAPSSSSSSLSLSKRGVSILPPSLPPSPRLTAEKERGGEEETLQREPRISLSLSHTWRSFPFFRLLFIPFAANNNRPPLLKQSAKHPPWVC